MQEIELLYFEGCPSWQDGLANLRQAMEAEGLSLQVKLVKIADPQQAQQERFLGSPSFRLHGSDLYPEDRERYDLSCRVYQTPQGLRGCPTVDMLRERLRMRLKAEGA